MKQCTQCQSVNIDGAKFCTGCGSPLAVATPVPACVPTAPNTPSPAFITTGATTLSSPVSAGPFVVAAIGLFLWGVGYLPFLDDTIYLHRDWQRLTYAAMGVGAVLVAVGILAARPQLARVVGGGAVTLLVIGFAIEAVSNLPFIITINSSWGNRGYLIASAAGYVLLGVAVLTAIPKVVRHT